MCPVWQRRPACLTWASPPTSCPQTLGPALLVISAPAPPHPALNPLKTWLPAAAQAAPRTLDLGQPGFADSAVLCESIAAWAVAGSAGGGRVKAKVEGDPAEAEEQQPKAKRQRQAKGEGAGG